MFLFDTGVFGVLAFLAVVQVNLVSVNTTITIEKHAINFVYSEYNVLSLLIRNHRRLLQLIQFAYTSFVCCEFSCEIRSDL